jgi:hypothetical protein
MPFPTLFEHVKDDAIHLNQTKHLLQVATCRAHHERPLADANEGQTEVLQDHSTLELLPAPMS